MVSESNGGGRTLDPNAQPTRVYTPAQLRILERLSDGLPHSRAELCLVVTHNPAAANFNHLHQVIFGIRQRMRNSGEMIISELRGGKLYYRHVRLLRSPYEP